MDIDAALGKLLNVFTLFVSAKTAGLTSRLLHCSSTVASESSVSSSCRHMQLTVQLLLHYLATLASAYLRRDGAGRLSERASRKLQKR